MWLARQCGDYYTKHISVGTIEDVSGNEVLIGPYLMLQQG